eukprot:gene2590-1609_t
MVELQSQLEDYVSNPRCYDYWYGRILLMRHSHCYTLNIFCSPHLSKMQYVVPKLQIRYQRGKKKNSNKEIYSSQSYYSSTEGLFEHVSLTLIVLIVIVVYLYLFTLRDKVFCLLQKEFPLPLSISYSSAFRWVNSPHCVKNNGGIPHFSEAVSS